MLAFVALLFVLIVGLLIVIIAQQEKRAAREEEERYSRDPDKFKMIHCAACVSKGACSAERRCIIHTTNHL